MSHDTALAVNPAPLTQAEIGALQILLTHDYRISQLHPIYIPDDISDPRRLAACYLLEHDIIDVIPFDHNYVRYTEQGKARILVTQREDGAA